MLDFSQSVQAVHEGYRARALQLVRRLNIGARYTRVALVKFSSKFRTRTEFHFDAYSSQSRVLGAIERAPYTGGTTCTNHALQFCEAEFLEEHGARPGLARTVLVVFTDGFSQEDPRPAAQKLRQRGLEVHVVAARDALFWPNLAELRTIAGDFSRVHVSDEEFERLA